MANVVRFSPNVPIEIILKSEGVEVQGFKGPEIRPDMCMCAGCVSRRQANLKWHNKNKKRRLEQAREYKRRKRAEARTKAKQVSDAELERRMTMKDWRKGIQ